MSSFSGILFDKDGTLLDYHETWMPANRAVALELAGGDRELRDELLIAGGWVAAEDRVASGSPLAAGDLEDIADTWLPILKDAAPEKDALVRYLDKAFPENMDATAVCPLAPLLDSLRARGFALGVATADSVYGLQQSLQPFDIMDRFAFAAGFDSGHGRKPGPGMVFGFCEAVDLTPESVVVIGDNRHDVEMAMSAGSQAIGVLTGTSSADELTAAGAIAVLTSIAELPDYLMRDSAAS